MKSTVISSKVRKMLAAGEKVEDIRLYITGTKFRNITGDIKTPRLIQFNYSSADFAA